MFLRFFSFLCVIAVFCSCKTCKYEYDIPEWVKTSDNLSPPQTIEELYFNSKIYFPKSFYHIPNEKDRIHLKMRKGSSTEVFVYSLLTYKTMNNSLFVHAKVDTLSLSFRKLPKVYLNKQRAHIKSLQINSDKTKLIAEIRFNIFGLIPFKKRFKLLNSNYYPTKIKIDTGFAKIHFSQEVNYKKDNITHDYRIGAVVKSSNVNIKESHQVSEDNKVKRTVEINYSLEKFGLLVFDFNDLFDEMHHKVIDDNNFQITSTKLKAVIPDRKEIFFDVAVSAKKGYFSIAPTITSRLNFKLYQNKVSVDSRVVKVSGWLGSFIRGTNIIYGPWFQNRIPLIGEQAYKNYGIEYFSLDIQQYNRTGFIFNSSASGEKTITNYYGIRD